MNIQKYSMATLLFIAGVFILYVGKSLLMPLVLAVIAWFIIKEILFILNKIQLKGISMPLMVQKIVASILVIGSFFVLSTILMSNADDLQAKIPEYQANLNEFVHNAHLPISLDYKVWLAKFTEQFDLSSILKAAVSSVSSLFSNAVLILLYLLFILIEAGSFKEKIAKLYPVKKDKDNIDSILSAINKSMSSYISLKTLTSAMTGFLSFIVLEIVGVDFAFFWAYLIFLLNFVPTIGSMIATIFPVLLAFLQFGTWVQPAVVLASVGGIQVLVGNILEPRLMGNSLNVSPLVVLISLAFWGWLWGIIGMIISVPITIMIIIVCAQFTELRWIGIILSSNGDLPKIMSEEDEI